MYHIFYVITVICTRLVLTKTGQVNDKVPVELLGVDEVDEPGELVIGSVDPVAIFEIVV